MLFEIDLYSKHLLRPYKLAMAVPKTSKLNYFNYLHFLNYFYFEIGD